MAGTTMDRALPGRKGLKADAVGFVNGVVVGVASTAPAYSLAASLGFVVIAVGAQSPAIMLLAFFPMAAIAAAYYYLNRVDPDCGTSFTWVSRAMGPWLGWMTGWAIIVADIIVMANLAEIAADLHLPPVRHRHLRMEDVLFSIGPADAPTIAVTHGGRGRHRGSAWPGSPR